MWLHFDETGPQKAKCKLCNNILSGHGGSTSNFRKHLQTKNPTALLEQVRQEDSTASGSTASTTAVSSNTASAASTSGTGTSVQRTRQSHTSFARTPIGPVRQSKVDGDLGKMIALDLQPFSVVDDTGFRRFFKALDPSYILPNRKAISNTLLPQLYSKIKQDVLVKVSKASAVCLTTDCWTLKTTTSFMAVTCHFIDEDFTLLLFLLNCFSFTERHIVDNLACELKKITDEWAFTSNVAACVTDNASNITAAIRKTEWKHVTCFAHTLNLIVRESLKHIQVTVAKVKNVVEYFHRSTVVTQWLKATQKQMGLEELRLKQDVIRWNSTYCMLMRFWQQKEAIIFHSTWFKTYFS